MKQPAQTHEDGKVLTNVRFIIFVVFSRDAAFLLSLFSDFHVPSIGPHKYGNYDSTLGFINDMP